MSDEKKASANKTPSDDVARTREAQARLFQAQQPIRHKTVDADFAEFLQLPSMGAECFTGARRLAGPKRDADQTRAAAPKDNPGNNEKDPVTKEKK